MQDKTEQGKIVLTLADKVARQKANILKVPYDELYGYLLEQGCLAISRYNASYGVPFEAFIRKSLQLVCFNYLRDKHRQVALPRYLHDLAMHARKLRKQMPWHISNAELADMLGTTEQELASAELAITSTTCKMIDNLSTNEVGLEVADNSEQISYLQSLPDKQFQALQMHFEANWSIAKIAKRLKAKPAEIANWIAMAKVELDSLQQSV